MTTSRLLAALSADNFISGTRLGELLGVSRTAVWKQIQQLEQLGIEVITQRQQGYKLAAPLSLFNKAVIGQQLKENASQLELKLFSTLGSTNDEAKQLLAAGKTSKLLVLTEMQTSGKGRRGKSWVSPFGSNLALTLGFKIDADISSLQGLSLALAVELQECLNEFCSIDLGFKWPNDIYLNNKKLCGILVEVGGDFSGPFNLVLGIGLNLTKSNQFNSIEQPFICLEEAGFIIDKNLLAARLAIRIEKMLPEFLTKGFAAWQEKWNKQHLWYGKQAVLINGANKKQVEIKEVNSHGELMVINEDGQLESINSGELSLRLIE